MNMQTHFAEVIESHLDHYTAQCWQWDNFPQFGNLVCVEEEARKILGVVTTIATGSIDPTRTPYPYQKTEVELRAEQPQIFEFLRTIFTVTIVGSYTHVPTPKIAHFKGMAICICIIDIKLFRTG